MTEKAQNYTPEQTAEIIGLYTTGSTVEVIAEQFGKSVRSIVAKLSREGVYVPKAATKGQSRVTKADLINQLAAKFDIEATEIASLEKASLAALELLVVKAKA